MPIPLNTRCGGCFHPVLSHEISSPGTGFCGRCQCKGFFPEERATVNSSSSGPAIRTIDEMWKAFAQMPAAPFEEVPPILEQSTIKNCPFCGHDKKNFKKKGGIYVCRTVIGGGPGTSVEICACEYCYCVCKHDKNEHSKNQVGCKVHSCKCDIYSFTGTTGSCPVALEIDDYLRSFEVPNAR